MVPVNKARLHILGAVTAEHTVPSDVLVRTVQGLQQTVWLLASMAEERQVSKRFKPGSDLRKHYTLRLAVPEAASYAMPISVGDERQQTGMLGLGGAELLGEVYRLCAAVQQGDRQSLLGAVPDSAYRPRVLREINRMLPRRDESWQLGFGLTDQPEIALDAKARLTIDEWLQIPEDRCETSVIGRLLRIDFAEHKVVIHYPPTQKELECHYLPDVEEDILDARRGLFQVTGQFVVDDDGHPKKLTDVRAIEPVDTSSATLTKLEYSGRAYEMQPPLVVEPSLDEETQQYFTAEIAALNILAHGRTRDALFADLAEQVDFVWRTYAESDCATLAEDAIDLRKRILERVALKVSV